MSRVNRGTTAVEGLRVINNLPVDLFVENFKLRCGKVKWFVSDYFSTSTNLVLFSVITCICNKVCFPPPLKSLQIFYQQQHVAQVETWSPPITLQGHLTYSCVDRHAYIYHVLLLLWLQHYLHCIQVGIIPTFGYENL